ncbi:MAG: alpha/beta fold hydrolase, partial [Brachymonas sp.]|nr:alpha/beta fold hydrolase [Brachymonas sp.]
AGSVLDLFANDTLNHQTVCEPFMPQNTAEEALRAQCITAIQTFFSERRREHGKLRQQPAHAPLREDALRVPASHFADMEALQLLEPWSRFVLLADPDEPDSTPWRMHVIDTAPGEIHRPALLLLHGYASYSLLWAELIPLFHKAGWRVLVPDLPGHGQSDKPKKVQRHSLAWHAALLHQWLQQAGFAKHAHRAALLHDSAALLQPHLADLDFNQTLVLQTQAPEPWRKTCQQSSRFDLDAHWALSGQEAATRIWSAPFPDAGHRAALQWASWANGATAQADDGGTIAAKAVTCMNVPANGAAFRQWLHQQACALLTAFSDRIAPRA